MLNSLTVFLAFLVFITFGYLSLVRILYRHQFDTPFSTLLIGLTDSQGLKHIGSSAFFVSLPATSLLLFWGWGPALMWLVVFHLIADSLVNLQVTSVEHQVTLSEYLVGSESTHVSYLMRGLIQFYLILLLAVVLTMLAQLIDKQSGLLFALIALIPAYRLLRNRKQSIPDLLKKMSALAVLALGLVFANKLGFAMYGDWVPSSEHLSWFRFNNTTMIAAILLTGGVSLANNRLFSDEVAKLAGLIVIIIIIILSARLIWLQPLLDAPINSTQQRTDELPTLMSFSLFLFAGFTTLFFRVFNSTAPSENELPPAADFGRVQAESLLLLLLALLLTLSLASAIGIGAWKTHYLDWANQTDFVGHLNLAINSLLKLIHAGATAGNLMHTILMAGLCIAGLSFLRVCIKALSLAQESAVHRINSTETFLQALLGSRLLQSMAAFLLSCYFIANSISVDTWLLLGILSWVIVMQLITAMTVNMTSANFARLVYGGQCLILIVLGGIQTIWTSIHWVAEQNFLYAGVGFMLLLIGIVLWWSPVSEIMSRFTRIEDNSLFK